MFHRAWLVLFSLVLAPGCRSGGLGASGKQERCGRLYDRLHDCKGFSEVVLREFDTKDAFVETCEKEWKQSRKTISCLDEETCEAFHRCAFGMSELDLRMLESIGAPSSGKTPMTGLGNDLSSEPPPTQDPSSETISPMVEMQPEPAGQVH